MKIAKNSSGEPYVCKYDWAEDCFVQCGESGLVLSSEGNYITSFFEAFPKNPNTFLRGEGKTIDEAERSAWEQLQKYLSCENHEFERRGYKNGAGFCKHCGLFKSHAFEPLTHCKICGEPTYYAVDKNNEFYCKTCKSLMPEEDKPDWMKRQEKLKKYLMEKVRFKQEKRKRECDLCKCSSCQNFFCLHEYCQTCDNPVITCGMCK